MSKQEYASMKGSFDLAAYGGDVLTIGLGHCDDAAAGWLATTEFNRREINVMKRIGWCLESFEFG